mmetsp:Transcript_21128/g.21536  ORF Transcript_21128/g.21536 Transcript_21128/m.21536 type:complete len:95 (+) Transcript_21128:38-322(+)
MNTGQNTKNIAKICKRPGPRKAKFNKKWRPRQRFVNQHKQKNNKRGIDNQPHVGTHNTGTGEYHRLRNETIIAWNGRSSCPSLLRILRLQLQLR